MPASEITREQEHVAGLYERVDALREQAAARLARALREDGGTAQSRLERDAAIASCTGQLARLTAAEDGLCFGRLDLRSGECLRIGRIGLRDESGDGEPLLLDWRAPAARAFYVATASAPLGVRRRRHITMRGRRVTGLDDEVLDRAELAGASGLTGEAALLAAVQATRTGKMRDIVATLQAEQDAIIRSAPSGVLVVQGGPGTGKTAVALHRAAYLLYTHRHLAARGVLVVGPSATFLDYIGQVLPGLGETNVLLRTVGELFPGVAADRAEPRLAEEVKGRAAMAGVLAAAVRGRQADGPADIEFDGETLRLDAATVREAARRARATRLPHNEARPLFQRQIIAALAVRYADLAREFAERLEADVADIVAAASEAIEADLAAIPQVPGGSDDEQDLADLRRQLRADRGVRAQLDDLWPLLTPQRLLDELFASQERLAAAAPGLTAAERAALLREPGGWSTADVPLLDEAAELLGRDERAELARAERQRAQRIAYAQGVLDIAAGSSESGEGALTAADLLDAATLAERQEAPDYRTVAERAAADRTWTFGHVIVDEAQELSPMAWRLLARRCPARSMTVVGDVAQASGPAGATSWEQALGPLAGDRWRLTRLTVNYRTPAEIMAATEALLDAIDPGQPPPQAVRATGTPPWRMATTRDGLPAALARTAAEAAAAADGGRLAVIVPDTRLAELGGAVSRTVPGVSFGRSPDLTSPVVVLGARQAKGLEFDSVLIADPAAILAASPRGRNDLYVAMTRSTQRLGVLHPGRPPAELAALRLRPSRQADG